MIVTRERKRSSSVVKKARKLDRITSEEMLELAASGAKVLHIRAVEYARRHGVTLHVRSSFNNNEGTIVYDPSRLPEGAAVEESVIAGVAVDLTEAKISVVGVPDVPMDWLSQRWNINISQFDLFAAGVSGVLVASLAVFFQKTRVGRALRAVADDHQAALSVGIPLKSIWVIVWTVAGTWGRQSYDPNEFETAAVGQEDSPLTGGSARVGVGLGDRTRLEAWHQRTNDALATAPGFPVRISGLSLKVRL